MEVFHILTFTSTLKNIMKTMEKKENIKRSRLVPQSLMSLFNRTGSVIYPRTCFFLNHRTAAGFGVLRVRKRKKREKKGLMRRYYAARGIGGETTRRLGIVLCKVCKIEGKQTCATSSHKFMICSGEFRRTSDPRGEKTRQKPNRI